MNYQTKNTKGEKKGNNNNNNNNKGNWSCSILKAMHWPWLFYLENWSVKSFGF